MAGDGSVGVRVFAVLCLNLLACLSAQGALAADCPGHPDALGTSRTLVVDPRQHPRIGTMQYPETLPLEDHEVVLTFDDGPLPRNSNQVLDILAAQCVKATFFIIGRMAQYNPEGVRKLRDAGHSIGTHSQNHPLTFHKMPIEKARQEIDEGIASTLAALGGDKTALAPFFRIPGLLRAEGVEEYLASQGIQTWSADFPADDWRHIPSSRVYDLAMKRLEAKGKGILLLHDIQARTVAALPRILQDLKARGYRIVHVVPATPERPATPTEPQQWQLHPPSENVAISHWPKIPRFVFAEAGALGAPALSNWGWRPEWQDLPQRRAHGVPLPREAPWPRQAALALENATITLPAPAQGIFEMPDRPWTAARALAASVARSRPVSAEQRETDGTKLVSAEAGASRRRTAGKSHPGHTRRIATSHTPGRGTAQATTHTGKRPLKRLVQVKKGNV